MLVLVCFVRRDPKKNPTHQNRIKPEKRIHKEGGSFTHILSIYATFRRRCGHFGRPVFVVLVTIPSKGHKETTNVA